MKRILLVVAALIGILVGLGFIVPAVAKWRAVGGLSGSNLAFFALGLLLVLGSVTLPFRLLRNRSN